MRRTTPTKPPAPTAETYKKLYSARRTVRHWSRWFIPPAAMLGAMLWFRLDHQFVAVCLLSFPLITIRLVRAWSDYQQIRTAVTEAETVS